MSKEEWRDVVGFEGLYQISNKGKVVRVSTGKGARAGHVMSQKPKKGKGYVRISLRNNGQTHHLAVHRLVMAAFVGQCPHGYEVNHKNGNKADNRLVNLEYVTPSENRNHARDVLGVKFGIRGRVGEKSPSAKLSPTQVREIRKLFNSGLTYKEIGHKYGVGKTTIWRIANKHGWSHID